MPDKNCPRQFDPFSQQYSPQPYGLSDSYLPMQISPLANISKPSSCFSPSSLSPPMKMSPALFLVMHSPDSQTLSSECVISKPFRVRLLGLSAAWLLNKLAVPLSSLACDDVLNSPQVNLPTQSASAVFRMPSPWRSPFLNSPRYSYFSSISSPQCFWSSLKRPSQHLPLKQCRMPSSFLPSCILPKNTQFLYFLSVYGLCIWTSCSCRNIF